MLTLSRVVSVLLLLITAWYLFNFPFASALIGMGLIAYFIVLQVFPHCWLVVVPILMPLLYLAPFSGRLFFDEFDLLILVTISGYLWRYKEHIKPAVAMNFFGKIILFVYCIVYAIAIFRGFLPFEGLDENSFSSYYSNLNSIRIGKGFVWAVCLLPLWRYSEAVIPNDIQRFFACGVALGGIGVFLAMLWERGFFHDVFYAENRYELFGNLLNFHTQYRATGLFAEMHTGDTATDGYLILALPLIAYFLFLQRSKIQFTVGFVSLLGVIYSIAVTFSRGLYLGVGVIVFSLLLIILFGNRKGTNRAPILISILLAGVFALFAFFLFKSGGVLSLIGGVILFLFGVVVMAVINNHSQVFFYVVLCLAFLGGVYLLMHGLLSSKWNEVDFSTAMILTVSAVIVFGSTGGIYGKIWEKLSSFRQRLFVALLFCMLTSLSILALFGSRMEARFETVNSDVQGRMAHWKNAIDIMSSDPLTNLFGQGVGSFPITYYWVTQRGNDVGGYTFAKEDGNSYVSFAGSPDVKLSQRISLSPDKFYEFSVDVRTLDPEAFLQIRICHRQLIEPMQWNPTCFEIDKVVEKNNGKWQSLKYTIPSNKLGSLELYLKAPLVITFENRREYAFNLKKQTLLDIDNLSIKSPEGNELISNGDFERGIDNWYAFYDFNHMPWHIKNLFVNAYFDSGVAGIFMFVLLVFYSAFNMYKRFLCGNYFSLSCLLCVVGFFCVGCFGTMMDGPRISFFFYFIILINMLLPARKL